MASTCTSVGIARTGRPNRAGPLASILETRSSAGARLDDGLASHLQKKTVVRAQSLGVRFSGVDLRYGGGHAPQSLAPGGFREPGRERPWAGEHLLARQGADRRLLDRVFSGPSGHRTADVTERIPAQPSPPLFPSGGRMGARLAIATHLNLQGPEKRGIP